MAFATQTSNVLKFPADKVQPNTSYGLMTTLRATRAWVRAMQPATDEAKRPQYLSDWHNAFVSLNVPMAAQQWDRFMQHLAMNAEHAFYIGCACCGALSPDERRLLSALASQQYGSHAAALGYLSYWFDGRGIDDAMEFSLQYAGQLLAHGHCLPEDPDALPTHDLVSADRFVKPNRRH